MIEPMKIDSRDMAVRFWKPKLPHFMKYKSKSYYELVKQEKEV